MQQEKINRPMNCFMIYKRDKKHAILKENPMINFRDISKIVADQWREETEEVKEHYKNLAKIEMKNHQEKYPDYRFPSSKGKNSKKKGSKLHMVVTQELKRSVGRPKKLPTALSPDKSEKLQEYIKRLKNINGITFQDSAKENSQKSLANDSNSSKVPAENVFTVPDASDAIYKHRVLPPLVQNRGYITPVKSEYFIPVKNSQGNGTGIYSTPVHTPMNRNLNSPVLNRNMSAQNMSSPLQHINRATPQTFSSPVQQMSLEQHLKGKMATNGQPVSNGAQPMNRDMPVSTPLMNRNLPLLGNLSSSASAQPMINHTVPQMNRNLPNGGSPRQYLSSPVQQMNLNVHVNGQQPSGGAQQMNRNLPFGNMTSTSQPLPVTLAQQHLMNRTFASPVSQQMIHYSSSTGSPSKSMHPSAVSHQMPMMRNPIDNQKKDVVKIEEMVDKQIQRVGTPSTPGYSPYTSPISQQPRMATPESPQNLLELGQFRSVKPMAVSEMSDSPKRNPSYFPNGGLEQSPKEMVPHSPKRGRPRGASSPGQQFSFLCEICSSSFVRRHDLKRHLLLHTGLGPYRCCCGRHFSRQDFYSRHVQSCRSKTIFSPPKSPALSVDESNPPSQEK